MGRMTAGTTRTNHPTATKRTVWRIRNAPTESVSQEGTVVHMGIVMVFANCDCDCDHNRAVINFVIVL